MKNVFWTVALILMLAMAWLTYGWIVQGNDNFCKVPKVDHVTGL